MSTYDAIIIGGGINGLVAGATLSKRGKSVCILEQADTPGGMATLSKENGPPLAHAIHNLSPLVLRELGVETEVAKLLGNPVPTISLCDDGRHIVFDKDTVTWTDGTPHPDAEARRALVTRLTQYGGLLRQLAEASPPGGAQGLLTSAGLKQLLRLGKLGIGLKRLGKPEMRRFLQILLSNAFDLILDDMPDGPVAGMLAADAVRGAAAGPRSPGTVFNLIYRMGHGGAVRLPAGGPDAIITCLVQAAQTQGCTLKTGQRVNRILMDRDTISGVETQDGQTFTAPTVLSSAAPQHIARMLGAANLDIEAARRIRNIRARGTVAKVNLQLDSDAALPGLENCLGAARLLYAPSADYVETAFNPAKYGQMSKTPVIEAVQTKSAKGTSWLSALVQYAPSDLEGGWTDARRAELGQITRATLSRALPGLEDRVTRQQVISPDQIQSATGAPGGHWHHAEMSLDQVLTIRPANGLSRYAMGPAGLYLCGASAHPGGDIMGLAGHNAALSALEDMS